MNVLADVTKAFQGTVSQTLARVTRNVNASGLSMTALLYDDQVAELQMSGFDLQDHKIKSISRTTSVSEVALQMALEAASTAPHTVFFSFHATVLALGSRLDPECRSKIFFCPWSKAQIYLHSTQPELVLERMPQNALAAPIEDSDAFKALKAVLQEKGANSPSMALKQTMLRPLLSQRDHRFYKTNPAAGAPRYISGMLERARKAGLIAIADHPVNPTIWLVQQPELQIVPSANKEPATPIPSGSAPVTRAPAEIYDSILRSNNMGPFPNLRHELYSAIGVTVERKLTVEKLITECLTQVKDQHQDDKKIPWTSVRNFFVRLLARRPVLLDPEGKATAPSFQSSQTVIVGVDAQFKEVLDGELIMFLLEHGAEIKYMDAPALVGTIYMTHEFKHEDQLNRVLTHLKGAGLIRYVDDTVQLTSTTLGNVTVMPQRKG